MEKDNFFTRMVWCGLVLSVLLSCWIQAAENSDAPKEDFLEMSIEELMDVQVVSSSRQEQNISESSVPITVITAEDIHYSGLTNLYEIIQFAPGVDLLQTNRNEYALGIRGLHDVTSDRVLTLVNGRPADNIAFGGSELLELPILLEDVERIEIIRGPAGAAWGANAYSGVVNIITKKPEDCLGLLTSTQWNEFGDNYHLIRYGDKKDKLTWRASVGYNKQESSSDALSGEKFISDHPFTPGVFETRDFRRNLIADTDFSYQLSQEKKLTFGAGHSHTEAGAKGFFANFPQKDGFSETTRLYTKFDQQFNETTSGYLQWTGNISNRKRPSMTKYQTYENDIQYQLNFVPAQNHKTSIGGNVTLMRINQSLQDSEDMILAGEPFDEQSVGVFGIDRWKVTDKWDLETQLRGDWYSETQIDWAGRLSAFYHIDSKKEHTLRFSAARAFRTPRSSLRQLACSRLFFPGVGHLLQVAKADELDNEEILALEAGYTGRLSRELLFKANTYYHRYKDLIGYSPVSSGPGNLIQTHTPSNIGGARAAGVELELEYRKKNFKITPWYAYNAFWVDGDITGENAYQCARAYSPSKHKIGLTGRLFFPNNLTFNVNYKYSSFTGHKHGPHGGPHGGSVPKFHRLDLSLAKGFKLNETEGEVLVGVSDLLNETEEVVNSFGSYYYLHETPGRMFFARLQLKF